MDLSLSLFHITATKTFELAKFSQLSYSQREMTIFLLSFSRPDLLNWNTSLGLFSTFTKVILQKLLSIHYFLYFQFSYINTVSS